jgi:hypothetical protein
MLGQTDGRVLHMKSSSWLVKNSMLGWAPMHNVKTKFCENRSTGEGHRATTYLTTWMPVLLFPLGYV